MVVFRCQTTFGPSWDSQTIPNTLKTEKWSVFEANQQISCPKSWKTIILWTISSIVRPKRNTIALKVVLFDNQGQCGSNALFRSKIERVGSEEIVFKNVSMIGCTSVCTNRDYRDFERPKWNTINLKVFLFDNQAQCGSNALLWSKIERVSSEEIVFKNVSLIGQESSLKLVIIDQRTIEHNTVYRYHRLCDPNICWLWALF